MTRPLLCLMLAGCLCACQTTKPAQYNATAPVPARQSPSWLVRVNTTEETIMQPFIYLWNSTVGKVTATALNITPTGVIAGQVQIDTRTMATGTTSK